jgi:hypothetical protein
MLPAEPAVWVTELVIEAGPIFTVPVSALIVISPPDAGVENKSLIDAADEIVVCPSISTAARPVGSGAVASREMAPALELS